MSTWTDVTINQYPLVVLLGAITIQLLSVNKMMSSFPIYENFLAQRLLIKKWKHTGTMSRCLPFDQLSHQSLKKNRGGFMIEIDAEKPFC